MLSHQPSLSTLTLPGHADLVSVVLAASARDARMRALREEHIWTSVAARVPSLAPWLRHTEPVTGVMPFAGLADLTRDYAPDGEPIVAGLVALGDAQAATSPLLGRGTSLAALAAGVLRDVLACDLPDITDTTARFWVAHGRIVTPWIRATQQFSRHRLAEMAADAAGEAYQPDDPGWRMVLALRSGATVDPVLARASARIAGLLEPPGEVLSDPIVQARLHPHRDAPPYSGEPSGAARILAG